MRIMEEIFFLNGFRCDKEFGICLVFVNILFNLFKGKLINNIFFLFLIIVSLSEIIFFCKCICMDVNCIFYYFFVFMMVYLVLLV